MEPRLNL